MMSAYFVSPRIDYIFAIYYLPAKIALDGNVIPEAIYMIYAGIIGVILTIDYSATPVALGRDMLLIAFGMINTVVESIVFAFDRFTAEIAV
jgi:diacylglycerol kinase